MIVLKVLAAWVSLSVLSVVVWAVLMRPQRERQAEQAYYDLAFRAITTPLESSC